MEDVLPSPVVGPHHTTHESPLVKIAALLLRALLVCVTTKQRHAYTYKIFA